MLNALLHKQGRLTIICIFSGGMKLFVTSLLQQANDSYHFKTNLNITVSDILGQKMVK
jgi:hypothetical protein